jgi:hypothetical protein
MNIIFTTFYSISPCSYSLKSVYVYLNLIIRVNVLQLSNECENHHKLGRQYVLYVH